MTDPINGDLYIVSKRTDQSRVYRAPASALVNGATVTLEYKATLPWGWATGGDISPDGDEILIRGYSNASLRKRPVGTDLWSAFAGSSFSVPLAGEPQGESIAFDANGDGYYTLSEGTYQPIYYSQRVPEPATIAILGLGAIRLFRRNPRALIEKKLILIKHAA